MGLVHRDCVARYQWNLRPREQTGRLLYPLLVDSAFSIDRFNHTIVELHHGPRLFVVLFPILFDFFLAITSMGSADGWRARIIAMVSLLKKLATIVRFETEDGALRSVDKAGGRVKVMLEYDTHVNLELQLRFVPMLILAEKWS